MQLRPRQRQFVDRASAKAAGSRYYWTGTPCRHGHIADRLTSNGMCTVCMKRHNDLATDSGQSRLRARARREANRDSYNENQRRYYRKHYTPGGSKFSFWCSIRQQHIKRATPPWADKAAIRAIYESCPHGHHVDHIIPLRGRNVCGLHVESNLRHLPASENHRKYNSWEGDCAI